VTDQRYIGASYRIPAGGGFEAIRMLARPEGTLLDPI
jgi:1-aminocyclopropane-1-carboxylate deaminase/D-cysteine desulfhydrase-like pyridoxal-dependent ACC family enzyme